MKMLLWAVLVSLSLVVSDALAREGQTLKERLSDKASDSQRVDNCRVPVERRGSTPRPDCAVKPQPSRPTAETPPSHPR